MENMNGSFLGVYYSSKWVTSPEHLEAFRSKDTGLEE